MVWPNTMLKVRIVQHLHCLKHLVLEMWIKLLIKQISSSQYKLKFPLTVQLCLSVSFSARRIVPRLCFHQVFNHFSLVSRSLSAIRYLIYWSPSPRQVREADWWEQHPQTCLMRLLLLVSWMGWPCTHVCTLYRSILHIWQGQTLIPKS